MMKSLIKNQDILRVDYATLISAASAIRLDRHSRDIRAVQMMHDLLLFSILYEAIHEAAGMYLYNDN